VLLIKVSAKLKVKCFLIRYFSYTQNVMGELYSWTFDSFGCLASVSGGIGSKMEQNSSPGRAPKHGMQNKRVTTKKG
jgi:hypothetical protein